MYLPQALDQTLESRQLGYGGSGGRNTQTSYRRRTPWSRYGRWILAGILIIIALVLLFLILAISRRRKRRNQTRYGTNTPMANQPPVGQNNKYDGGNPGYGNEGYGNQGYGNQGNGNQGGYAPPAGVPPTYGGHGANDGYYGQQGGVTQPQGAYVK